MSGIDLHVHSSCSDGTLSPAQLVAYALEKNLEAFALTDHDTTEGLAEALACAEHTSLEVIPGIEFSTQHQGKDVHIVGLDMDYQSPEFVSHLCHFRASRDLRNDKMIRKFQEQGIAISREVMEASFGDAVWTRAHFARYLLDRHVVSNMQEAFDLYLSEGRPCYVPRERVTPAAAVYLIYRTGGIPILAHPMLYRFSEAELDDLIGTLKKSGLMAIEALYSTHSRKEENLARLLAKRHGLLISGGSDFHGSNKPHIDLGCGRGNLSIPYHILTNLRNRRKQL